MRKDRCVSTDIHHSELTGCAIMILVLFFSTALLQKTCHGAADTYERRVLTAKLGCFKSCMHFALRKPSFIILTQMAHIILAVFLVAVMSPLSFGQTFSIATAPRLYSSDFVQPQPPMIQTEFRANYMQVIQIILIPSQICFDIYG